MVVHWEKDDKRISTTENRMTQNYQDNSLTISGTIVRDSGVYTCVITNGLDEDRSYAFLTVKGKNSILVFYVVFTLQCQKFMLSSLYNARSLFLSSLSNVRSLCFLHCQTSEVYAFFTVKSHKFKLSSLSSFISLTFSSLYNARRLCFFHYKSQKVLFIIKT